jgi:hypothetical protein
MDIGDKNSIAFIIGERAGRDLRVVNVYVGGELITCYDNTAYVPQFVHSIAREATDIADRNISEQYSFLNWGPTTDNVSARGVLEGSNLRLTCDLRDGKKVSISVPADKMVAIYREAADALRALHA